MVRAILNDRKSQTRRLIKLPRWAQPCNEDHDFELDGMPEWPHAISRKTGCLALIECAHGRVGDRLWVREAWQQFWAEEIQKGRYTQDGRAGSPSRLPETMRVVYRADGEISPHHAYGSANWKPSIFMPRWASRITLEIIKIRVEHLQEISVDDAIAEGVPRSGPHRHGADGLVWEDHPGHIIPDPYASRHNTGAFDCPLCPFVQRWDTINAKRAPWASNPLVWVIEFKKLP